MDALWVNERLLDYSDTLNDISDSIDTLNLADPIVLSEEEEESSSSGKLKLSNIDIYFFCFVELPIHLSSVKQLTMSIFRNELSARRCNERGVGGY